MRLCEKVEGRGEIRGAVNSKMDGNLQKLGPFN